MDSSDKLIAIGVGFLIACLVIIVGILSNFFSDRGRAKRLWAVGIPGVIVGTVLILMGVVS